MDEIAYLKLYNEAVTASERITAPETKRAVQMMLQLLNGLRDMLTEIQDAAEDE